MWTNRLSKPVLVGVIALGLGLAAPMAAATELLWRSALISSVVAYVAANPFEADGIGVELGHSADGRDLIAARVTSRWLLDEALIHFDNYQLDALYHVNFAQWNVGSMSNESQGFSRHQLINNVVDLYLTFHHQLLNQSWYVETDIGFAYASAKQLADIHYGSHLQIVNGWTLGYPLSQSAWTLKAKFQHYSDNDISSQNPGENLFFIGLSRRFNPHSV